MSVLTYNKLVRDFIPEIIKAQGDLPEVSVLSEEGFLIELDRKLLEETKEYLDNGCVEELVDIYQIILTIIESRGISFEKFESLRKKKAQCKGEFKNHLFLSRIIK